MLFAISTPYIFLDCQMGVRLESAPIDQVNIANWPRFKGLFCPQGGASCFITETQLTQPAGREL